MDTLFAVPGILKRLLVELFAVFFFPASVIAVAGLFSREAAGGMRGPDGFGEWLAVAVGPILVGWALWDIFRPRFSDERWGVFFKVSSRVCSTHPSYVLLDLLVLGSVWFYYWIGMNGIYVSLATAVLFPVLRLFAWYVLGLRLSTWETAEAYKPALLTFLIFGGIFGGAAVIAALRG